MGPTSRSAWEGHADLKAALDGLASAKGMSANRVKAVANAAFQYAKDYKRVVHDVEVFLWKGEVEHRLAALYAIDAIMRQSQGKLGAKDVFVKRFSLHMNNTIAAVKKIPASQQGQVRHVIEEWQTRGFYTADEIEQAGGMDYSIRNSNATGATPASGGESILGAVPRASPSHADAASKEKLASLLSILKKQKELKEQQTGQQVQQPALLPQPPLLSQPPAHHLRHQQSPHAAGVSSSPHGRIPPSTYGRDMNPAAPHDRGRDRSRSRSRDRGHASDRSRGWDAGPQSRDRRSLSPATSPSRSRPRRDMDYGHRDSPDDGRDSKKPRSSRWGPSRPAEDDNRPLTIDTSRDHDRTSRFESRSPPRNRFDGPPPGPGLMPGPPAGPPTGPWPPTGYRGPPPPFRAGPPPPHMLPPRGPMGPPPTQGLMAPPPRGGPALQNFPPRGPPVNMGGPPLGGMPMGLSAGSENGSVRRFDGPPRHEGAPQVGEPMRSGGTPTSGGGDNSSGPSSEVCRKFLAGRCTFGDRCWHAHDQLPTGASRPRTELNPARRKTVLCANFPQGTCRYGDRCSFAHGEDDLDKSAIGIRRPPSSFDGGSGARGVSPHGSFENSTPSWPQQRMISPHHQHPVSGANGFDRPPPMQTLDQSRPPPFGSGPPASFHAAAGMLNGSAAAPGGRPYGGGLPAPGYSAPPGPPPPVAAVNQWAGAAAASGYGSYAPVQTSTSTAYGASYPRGPPATSQAPSPAVVAPAAPAHRERAASRDEDEAEGKAAEFSLQYDDDE